MKMKKTILATMVLMALVACKSNVKPTAEVIDLPRAETPDDVAAAMEGFFNEAEADSMDIHSVMIVKDGSVVYTPRENKVGKDSFVYTVTDEAGNVSREATVRIDILKPSDKEVYCDLSGDPALLAATWLRENGIQYEAVDIRQSPPALEELRKLHARSNLPLRRFFNTSGASYRELGLSQRLPEMSSEEQYALLTSHFFFKKKKTVAVWTPEDDWMHGAAD